MMMLISSIDRYETKKNALERHLIKSTQSTSQPCGSTLPSKLPLSIIPTLPLPPAMPHAHPHHHFLALSSALRRSLSSALRRSLSSALRLSLSRSNSSTRSALADLPLTANCSCVCGVLYQLSTDECLRSPWRARVSADSLGRLSGSLPSQLFFG